MSDGVAEKIWQTLSVLDVSNHVEKKNNFTYLSWAWAWGTLMKTYPDSSYEFESPRFYEGNTCEVWVTVTISGLSRQMWLPVMDYKNKSIVNPSSRDISDARMRCLVKCLAMFGLGYYLYAGEDLPDSVVGDIAGEPLDTQKVITATQFFIDQINLDEDETAVAPRIKAAFNRLTNDEQIAVNNNLKSHKFGNRQMNTILRGFIEYSDELEKATQPTEQ